MFDAGGAIAAGIDQPEPGRSSAGGFFFRKETHQMWQLDTICVRLARGLAQSND